ncbi:MAG: hydrogenase iron-sulfur subunit [Bacillota bacterium]
MTENVTAKGGQGGGPAWEPKVVAIFCNWCSYTGADLAGISRLKYAAGLRIVRVMCSGRVSPAFVLKAFHEGADGVLVGGCHPGDCHYLEGNYKTLKRKLVFERLLEQFGIEKTRFRLEWISGGEGDKFARVANELIKEIEALGPLGSVAERLRQADGLSLRAEGGAGSA